MFCSLSRNWGRVVFQGVMLILIGLMFLAAPIIVMQLFLNIFIFLVLFSGVLKIIQGFRLVGRSIAGWGLVASGIIAATVGVLTFIWPYVTLRAILFLVGLWALYSAVVTITRVIFLSINFSWDWRRFFKGIQAMVLSLFLIFSPQAAAIGLVWILGANLIARGIVQIGAGFTIRKLAKETSNLFFQ